MSDIQMTSDEARDIGKVLELVEKINKTTRSARILAQISAGG